MSNHKTMKSLFAAAGAAALSFGTAQAASTAFKVNFEELNDSGVEGSGTLTYTDDDPSDGIYGNLAVEIDFTGLDAGPHPMHIHGLFAGGATAKDTAAVDSVTPPPPGMGLGGDGDGFLETVEGVPFYGDVLLPLVTDPGNAGSFLTAGADGTASYDVTFDLSDGSIFLPSPATGETYSADDLFPLVLREIVIHGAMVEAGVGAGMFEVDGMQCADGENACFVGLLPVAAAEIAPIPLPGAALLFLTAGAGGVLSFRRKHR